MIVVVVGVGVVVVVAGQVAVVQVERVAVVIKELHWRRYRTDWGVQRQVHVEGGILVAHADRLLLLPDEHVVHHGTSAEHDAEADQYAGDYRWGGMELGERVEYDTCRKSKTYSINK